MASTQIEQLEARWTAARDASVEPSERIDALNALAWALRSDQVPRANALARQARQLSIEHQYVLGQARAARTLAMTMHDEQGLPEIVRLAEEARRLFDQTDDRAGQAGSRDFLASLHEFTGDLAGGLELALDALSIARELGDPVRQGYALSTVGGILAASDEFEVAVERLKEALALFEGVRDTAGVSTICWRLSRVLERAGRHVEAMGYAERCLAVAESTHNDFDHWASLTVMADLEVRQGDLEAAERLYRRALDHLRPAAVRKVMGAETQVALARVLLRRGALDDAEAELRETLSQIEGNPLTIVGEAAARDVLAELCERKGELREAIEHLRQAERIRQQIAQRDARNKLTQVQVRSAMEAAQRDAEVQKLRFTELHLMQAKLVEAEKMALLGRLAAGMAHELNTPLGVLRSNARLAARATGRLTTLLGDGEASRQAAKLAAVLASCDDTSDQAIDRIAMIAESFRRFSQLDQSERRSFDVREGLDGALALLAPTIPDSVEIRRSLAEVPLLRGWPRELNHAFMTVLQNAAQAIDGAGLLSVATAASEGHVVVTIADTGRGMSEEQVANLFDVTWSQSGSRTHMRLGLSAAYATTRKHGGTIEVESALGQGTTVRFRLPVRS